MAFLRQHVSDSVIGPCQGFALDGIHSSYKDKNRVVRSTVSSAIVLGYAGFFNSTISPNCEGQPTTEYDLLLFGDEATVTPLAGYLRDLIVTTMERIWHFVKDEDGPTAVEYAVILMLIFLVCLTTVQLIGQALSGSFQDSSDKIDQAIGS